MKKKSIFLLPLLFAFAHLFGQSKKTDLTKMNLNNTVKSITEKRYNPIMKFGEVQKGELSDIKTFSFNEAGFLTEESQNVPGEKRVTKKTYKYDDKCNMIQQDEFENGKMVNRYIYKYDGSGNATEYASYEPDGKPSNKIIFKNNDKGQMIMIRLMWQNAH